MENKSNNVVIYNIISTLILQGIGFFSAPIFSRILGVSNYGILSVYSTWVAVFTMVFSLGTYGVLGIAKANFETNERIKFYSSVMTLCGISYITLSLITVGGYYYAEGKEVQLLLLALVEGFAGCYINFASNKYIYDFEARSNLFLSLLVAFSTLAVSFFLLDEFPKEINYYGRIIGLAGPKILIAFGIILIFSFHGKDFFNFQYWFFCMPLSIPIAIHNIANLVLSQSDRVMLQQFVSNDVVGIYSLAYGFGGILVTIYGILYNSWLPFYFEYAQKNQKDEIKNHGKYYLQIYTFLSMGFLFVYQDVYQIFADESYWDGMNLIPVFLIGFYFMPLYSFSVMYELYMKKTKIMGIVTMWAAVSNIALNYMFIRLWSALGAAIASSVAYCIEFLLHYVYAKYMIDGDYPFGIRMFIPEIAMMISSVLIFCFVSDLRVVRWSCAFLITIILLYSIKKRGSIL